MEGACGKGREAQVGWLKDTSAQHQVRANSSSKQKHVSGVLNTQGGISEEDQTCCLLSDGQGSPRGTDYLLGGTGHML